MTLSVTHKFVSALPDDPDATLIRPSNWNDTHTVTGSVDATQMPALTGDVTTSAGSVATTIANSAVTLAKMANMATSSLIYRKTAGSGAPEVNTLSTLKTDLGLTGTNSGDQTITLTGDVTGSGTGSFAATIANSAVTLAKMADMATSSLIYRKTAGSGAPEVNTLATLKTDLGLTGTNSGDQTITLTGDVTGTGTGSFAATIAANAVTNAKAAQMAAHTYKGNNTGSTANALDLTTSQVKADLAIAPGDLTGLGTGVATMLGTFSSANIAAACTDETGSGALVFGTNPAFDGETFSTAATVTAGTNAQGQGALTKDYNVITTASNNPSGVTLPTATVGRRVVIVNKGANAINVYPASGGSIDALSANASIQIPVSGSMEFNAPSTTQWYSSVGLNTNTTALGSAFTFTGFGGTWGATQQLATTYNTTHSGGYSTLGVSRVVSGSGASGPSSGDAGLYVNAAKSSYLSSAVEGEVDGIYCNVWQGNKGDSASYLGSASKVRGGTGPTGGVLGLEAHGIWLDSSGNKVMEVSGLCGFGEASGGQSSNTGFGGYFESLGAAAGATIVQPWAGVYVGCNNSNGNTTPPIFTNAFVAAGTRASSHIYFKVVGGMNEAGDVVIGSSSALGADGTTATKSGGTPSTLENITGMLRISGQATGQVLQLFSNDAGAANGPDLGLYRQSASPAASDTLGQVVWYGRDSSATDYPYVAMSAAIIDPSNVNQTGQWSINTGNAGAFAARMTIQAGVQVGAPTGGDKGTGTVNLTTGYYVQGVKVVAAKDTGWTAMTGSSDKATAYATSTVTLAQLARRVMAIQNALTAVHALIGT